VNGPHDSDVPLGTPVDIDRVKVWYFPSKHLRRLYYAPSLLKTLLLKLNTFDLVHLHSVFLWPTWAAARVARKGKTPYIISPRGMLVQHLIKRKSFLVKTAWIRLIEKNNIENAAAIHVTSQTEADELKRFRFRLPKVVYVPNGVDIPHSGTEDDISPLVKEVIDKKPYLLFIGRINWKKGLDRLIPAIALIKDVKLVIAGNDEEGYQPGLENLATSSGVRNRIIFAGPAYGNDKAALLKNASIVVLPSYSENFGNSVFEAMAVGCPVIVTPEVGAAEIVAKTDAGLVLSGHPEVLSRGIQELLSNSQLMKEMGARGRQAVRGEFTWDVLARQMENIYQDITNQE
jgi:glycosyltransferase involved in cell wall biosynthesis